MISDLPPNETESVRFSVVSSGEGRFPLGCTITYTDVNVSESKCLDSSVEFTQFQIAPEIYAGIVLLIIALAVYFYIMRSK